MREGDKHSTIEIILLLFYNGANIYKSYNRIPDHTCMFILLKWNIKRCGVYV